MAQDTSSLDWVNQEFRAAQARLGSALVPELLDSKTKALQSFLTRGVPTTKSEDWKYTNLSSVAKRPWVAATGLAVDLTLAEAQWVKGLAGSRVVLSNGVISQLKIADGARAAGIQILSLRDALASQASTRDAFLSNLSGDREKSPLYDLNTALFEDGVYISVPAGASVVEPIQIVALRTGDASYPRVYVSAGENSSVTLVELHSGDSTPGVTNAVTKIDAADGANVTHIKIQNESEDATHIAMLGAIIGRAGNFQSFLFNFGAGLARNEIEPVFRGPGAEVHLYGLTATSGKQHTDNYTVIHHAVPQCFSREMYKGVYNDSARGVFAGTIIVSPDAQKTNAIQSNRSLLLSPEATIETRPQLKIWADDVKCTHGATVGQLDDDALFYIRARGIDRETAQQILVHAFASEVVDQMSDRNLRVHVEQLLLSKLALRDHLEE